MTVLTVKPAFSSASVAATSVLSATPGTATSFGACATTRFTFPPVGSVAGAAGDCERTVSGVWLAETWSVIAPSARPAVVRFASASFCVWPVTSGTCTWAGPLETNTVTGLPTCTTIPADGSVEITCPCATFALDCSCVFGLKPTLRSSLSAAEVVSPSTAGSAAVPGPAETRMLTRAPFPTSLPLDGVALTTTPLGTVALAVLAATGSRFAERSRASATASV